MKDLQTRLSKCAPLGRGMILALLGITTIAATTIQSAKAGTYKSIHDFNPYPNGIGASGLVRIGDGNYYGVTVAGGKYGLGTIFKVTQSGLKSNVYNFSGGNGPAYPNGPLIQGSDGYLYGECRISAQGMPVIFRFNTVTSVMTVAITVPLLQISELTAGLNGAIYGTGVSDTAQGSVAFKYQPGGTFKIIHAFTPGEGDVYSISSTLTAGTDGYLYGMTDQGGSNHLGIIYKMNTSGSLIKLHELSEEDGYNSVSAPALGSDHTVWFSTFSGAPNQRGSIFKIGTNGQGFAVEHAYIQGEPNYMTGRMQQGADNRFYGGIGGFNDEIFSIGLDGSFKVLHTLIPQEGRNINGNFIFGTDGLLYGTSLNSAFRISTTGKFTTLGLFNSFEGGQPAGAPVIAPDGNYYGVTNTGGTNGIGTIYRITPAGQTTTLHSFTGIEGYDHTPLALGPDGKLYGTLLLGNSSTSVAYRANLDGTITPIHTFDNQTIGRLTLGSDGRFYAATDKLVYAISTTGQIQPVASGQLFGVTQIVLAKDGSLYTVQEGGPNGLGAIYKLSGANKTVVRAFNGTTDGSLITHDFLVNPSITLGPDGNLYGTADNTVYRYNVVNKTFTVLYSMPASSNKFLHPTLAIKQDGTIYGLIVADYTNCSLFSLNQNGVYTEVAPVPVPQYTSSYGYELALRPNGTLYGVTTNAGTHNIGALFNFPGF